MLSLRWLTMRVSRRSLSRFGKTYLLLGHPRLIGFWVSSPMRRVGGILVNDHDKSLVYQPTSTTHGVSHTWSGSWCDTCLPFAISFESCQCITPLMIPWDTHFGDWPFWRLQRTSPMKGPDDITQFCIHQGQRHLSHCQFTQRR